MSGKKPITFIEDVPADTEVSASHRFTSSGEFRRLEAITYVGHQLDLRYYVYHYDHAADREYPLTEPLGKAFLAGNGENFEFPVRREFSPDDELRIRVENTTGRNGADPYEYHANLAVVVDTDEPQRTSNLISKLSNISGDSGGWF